MIPKSRPNGGNTSRLGAGRILIFNEGSGRYRRCWEAHMYIPSKNLNAWGDGETPTEAYNNIKTFLQSQGSQGFRNSVS